MEYSMVCIKSLLNPHDQTGLTPQEDCVRAYVVPDARKLYAELDSCPDISTQLKLLDTLKFLNYPFHLDIEPEVLLQRFYQSSVSVQEIADTFTRCFGKTIICRKLTIHKKRCISIVEYLENQLHPKKTWQQNMRTAALISEFVRISLS